MAKVLIKQAEVKGWADDIINHESVESLQYFVEQSRNMKVEPFDNEAQKIAQTLSCLARDFSQAAVAVLSHLNISEQNRKLEGLKNEVEKAKR